MELDKLTKQCDLIFVSVPHGNALNIVKELYDTGIKMVDLSADFRLKNAEDYVKWYGWEHPYPDLLSKSVYGIPEIRRNEIKDAQLVSCPGCMAVTSMLIKPLIENKLIDTGHIIVDSKIGSSGAGSNDGVGNPSYNEVWGDKTIQTFKTQTHR